MSQQDQIFNRLIEQITRLGLKRSDLIRRTGYSPAYISRIMNRHMPVSPKLVISLHSRIPELNYNYIIYGEEFSSAPSDNNKEMAKLKTELEFAKQEIAWLKAVINKALAIEPELRSKLSEFIAPGMVVLPNTTQWTPQGAVA